MLVIIYVDDAIVAAGSRPLIDQFYSCLKDAFSLKVLGEPRRFLGCDLYRDR